jgi:hypothetical protein
MAVLHFGLLAPGTLRSCRPRLAQMHWERRTHPESRPQQALLAILPQQDLPLRVERFWRSERKNSDGGGCHHEKWDEQ